CIGGEYKTHDKNATHYISESQVTSRVFKLKAENGTVVEQEGLPPLPKATTTAAGALIGDIVYVTGGDSGTGATKNFWALNLGSKDPEWKSLTPWEGSARSHHIAAAQHDGREICLFIFSGRAKENGQWKLLRDAHKYSPSQNKWTRLRDIQVKGDKQARCVMAGMGASWGANHLFLFGGADGERFLILEAMPSGPEKTRMLEEHVGFNRDVLMYNCVTDRWSVYDQFPKGGRPNGRGATGGHVTTSAVRWGNSIVIPSGESNPGVRTSRTWLVTPIKTNRSFGTLNWAVLATYLAVLVGIGFIMSKRGKTTDDFFLAGRRIPWWAAGLSIYSTQLSAITYLAIPAKTYATDWTRFILQCGILAIAPIVICFFLPFYRRLNLTSAYGYLEQRFSLGLRLVGSASFVLFQLARMGIVILLPALALSAVTGVGLVECIVLMGVLSTAYTVLGGIEAVIWTDVLQTIVLLLGAVAAIVVITGQVEGGAGQLMHVAAEQGKLQWVNWEWSWTSDALLVVIIGAFFTNLLPYTSDQAVVQRYLTTPDEKQASRAIYTNGILAIPGSIIFFGLGTALFVFYQQNPNDLGPLAKSDQILPVFIVNELPAGLAGLVVAGVFAAAMSSLDSSMHSIATALSTDFVTRLRGEPADPLATARKLTLALGVLGTVSALIIATQDVKHLWDHLMGIIGLLLGALGGLFALGIFARHVAAVHAWAGLTACVVALWYVKNYTDLNGLLYGAVGTGSCFVVGWLLSILMPRDTGELEGLTWQTRAKAE
ncbi:MAG: hypothetical protein CMO66_04540, partial [Verrucomicrobiales bacterium]|nr:hypothetical protein [Verrucomicrobiales bacterium]